MRTYWSQAAMLLLGITLTVGFYEGRRLVKNTYKAVTAATSMTASAGRSRRDRDEDRDENADRDDEERHERKRRRSRTTASSSPTSLLVPGADQLLVGEKGDPSRARNRPRLNGRLSVAPIAIPARGMPVHEALAKPKPGNAPEREAPRDTAAAEP